MNFNEQLIRLRKAHGLSQEQLARQINVSRQAVSKWETSESQPDLAKLFLLTQVLDVSLDELCGLDPAPTDPAPSVPEKDQSDVPPRHGVRSALPLILGLLFSLIIGLAGGAALTRGFSPDPAPRQIVPVTISSLQLYSELENKKIRVIFTPAIANENFTFSVQKITATGYSTTFPVVYDQGTCISEVSVVPYEDFTLYGVIHDGENEHTSGLVKIFGLSDSGYSYEELWDQ